MEKEKRKQQLTQRLTRELEQLYDIMNENGKNVKDAIQEQIASTLADIEKKKLEKEEQAKQRKSAEQQEKAEKRADNEAKIERIKARTMNGEDPLPITKDEQISRSSIENIMKTYGIMSRKKVRELIKTERSNAEIQSESNWTIEGIEKMRQEELEKEKQRQEKLVQKRKNDEARRKKKSQEKREERTAKQEEREQRFRVLLAQGKPAKEIAELLGFEDYKTVYVKKSKEGLLGRKEIIALLLDCSDEEIAAKARINDVKVIEEIRTTEAEKAEQLKQEKTNKSAKEKGEASKGVPMKANEVKAVYTIKRTPKKKQKKEPKMQQISKGKVLTKEEKILFKMASDYEPIEEMARILDMSEYEVRFKLKKLNLLSRSEVERMIEAGEKDNRKIAGQNGNREAVSQIRKGIVQREKKINSIPAEKQEAIRGKLVTNQAPGSIAHDTKVRTEIVIAIREKWERDKELRISEVQRKVNLKIEFLKFESEVKRIILASPEPSKKSLRDNAYKILVLYDGLLTQRHYACIVYAFMKLQKYVEGIELAEEYLDLQESSATGVKNRINEVLSQEEGKAQTDIRVNNSIKKTSLELERIGDR